MQLELCSLCVLALTFIIDRTAASMKKDYQPYPKKVNFVTGPDSPINDEQDVQFMAPRNTLRHCQRYCDDERQCRFIWYYPIAADLSLCELYKRRPREMQWFDDLGDRARFYEVLNKIEVDDSDDYENVS